MLAYQKWWPCHKKVFRRKIASDVFCQNQLCFTELQINLLKIKGYHVYHLLNIDGEQQY